MKPLLSFVLRFLIYPVVALAFTVLCVCHVLVLVFSPRSRNAALYQANRAAACRGDFSAR